MTFTENLRSLIFWGIDALKGSPVRMHLADIRATMETDDPEGSSRKQKLRLKHLLDHATSTTEFYSPYHRQSLESFPVIDKNVIRERTSSFLSRSFQERDRIPAITSGSTGTPFKTYQSRDKRQRNTADTIYFAREGGYELGNKLFYFKIWSDFNRKPSWLQKLQNIVPVDVLNLKTNARIIVDRLNEEQNAVSFLGYVSAFETLGKTIENDQTIILKTRVNSVITMSEGITEYTRKLGERFFGCVVLSRYSNIENGILAQQTLKDPDNFTVNTSSYFVEILALEEDVPVSMGSLGRIVVTDYFNEVMPLIRYDTGDIGVMEEKWEGSCRRLVLTRIEGRKLDQIYNTNGALISSYIVYKNMWKYTELEQYQFIQKGPKEYRFKICMSGTFTREAELVAEFKEYLGADADFKVEYEREIPLLASGKRKKVMNEMYIPPVSSSS